jgi:hypothetical protein
MASAFIHAYFPWVVIEMLINAPAACARTLLLWSESCWTRWLTASQAHACSLPARGKLWTNYCPVYCPSQYMKHDRNQYHTTWQHTKHTNKQQRKKKLDCLHISYLRSMIFLAALALTPSLVAFNKPVKTAIALQSRVGVASMRIQLWRVSNINS